MARNRPSIPRIELPDLNKPSASRGQISQDVYAGIRQAILDCTFLPGMALSEQALSEELGVSRAPVREAFRQLVVEGLLEVLPQRGTFVARLSHEKVRDAVFVREVIECRAAELAAKAPLALRRGLEEIIEVQIKAAQTRDYSSHLSSDEHLHHQILDIAGHPHAWGPLRLARTGMNRIRHLSIPELGSNTIALEQHKSFVKAIVRGDAERARKAMREHIMSPLDFLDAILQRYPEYFSDSDHP